METATELIPQMTADEIEAIGECKVSGWGGLASDLLVEYILRVGLGGTIVFVAGYYVLEWLGVLSG